MADAEVKTMAQEKKLKIKTEDRAVLKKLERLFQESGNKVYLVGGYVRNCLLSLPPSDFDVASSLMPEELLALAEQAPPIRAKIINQRLGTVELQIDGRKIEHATFRRESYGPGGGHTPREVYVGTTMEEDARRRDFSVNALYYDLEKGTVLDPTGRGLRDLALRRLCSAVEDPAQMIKDDALRLLRLVRLACELGFTIEKNLFLAARKYSFQIHDISRERIAVELDKILLSDTRYALPQKVPAHKRAVLYLGAMGLLEELIPEFSGAKDIGKCKYHKYSVYMHTVCAVANTPPDKVLRYAALFHDVGKPAAWKATGKMLGHDALGAEIVHRRLTALGLDKKTVNEVSVLVKEHMYDLTGLARENKIRLKAQALGYETFYRLAALKEADVLGSGRPVNFVWTAEKFRIIAAKMQEEHTPMSVAELNITGNDLMQHFGIQGRIVGETLAALLKECVINPAQNSKEKLLRCAAAKLRACEKNGQIV